MLFNWLREKLSWQGGSHHKKEQPKLLELLEEAYCRQRENVANFTRHAEQMYYPHLREQLLRIVEEEKSHVQWLEQQIRKFGGTVPQPSVEPKQGFNTWENILLDLEEEQKDDQLFLSELRRAEHLDRNLAKGLTRLRRDELRHRQQLLDLLQKSEPDTVPILSPQSQDVEQQKQTWLAQQKMAWFERRRARWEADGKPIPWAEWLARREYEWTANELPNRELHWLLQLTTRQATDMLVPRVSERS